MWMWNTPSRPPTDTAGSTSEFGACPIDPRYGTLVVAKQTDPAGAPTPFAFSGAVNGTLHHGEQLRKLVDVGLTYTVTESVPAHWRLVGLFGLLSRPGLVDRPGHGHGVDERRP